MLKRRRMLAAEPARHERRDLPINRTNARRWLAVGLALAALAGWLAYRLSIQSGETGAAAMLVGGGAACTFLSMFVALGAFINSAK